MEQQDSIVFLICFIVYDKNNTDNDDNKMNESHILKQVHTYIANLHLVFCILIDMTAAAFLRKKSAGGKARRSI